MIRIRTKNHNELNLFLSLHDHIQHINFGKNISIPDRGIICCHKMKSGIGLLTTNPKYLSLYKTIEESKYLHALFNSSSI